MPLWDGDNINQMLNAIIGKETDENNRVYGSITLYSLREQTKICLSGAMMLSQVWLNGELVHENR